MEGADAWFMVGIIMIAVSIEFKLIAIGAGGAVLVGLGLIAGVWD